MPRIVRGGLIQATLCAPATAPVAAIKQAMVDKHVALIAEAAGRGAQVVCLQELFYGPYFCAEQQARWYELTERVPDGPTTRLMAEVAQQHGIVLILDGRAKTVDIEAFSLRRLPMTQVRPASIGLVSSSISLP